MELIVLSDIMKHYSTKGGTVSALEHINFSVKEGEFVAVP